ncbi:MAG TPA: DUF3179 domain-containing (seleno)protein [Gemmataceae bacterium]|nr:DUF3179 domain-containing (seleno)protein [Gemmataceae bacterium]
MRRLFLLVPLLAAAEPAAPPLIVKPDAFPTLVNPKCSHCRDEAKRRAGELKDDDRVLCWIRGYSDGGAIPMRFFLNPYRVISDTYGVFVYDADAGFARGFAPSLDFRFHGWHNGVMVMKHKDGTLYSCLTGLAIDGPQKGKRLTPVPTLVSNWGFWLKRYPGAVAYHMFDKYQPRELPSQVNEDSRKSRPGKIDKRLSAETMVLGVSRDKQARAYPLESLAKSGLLRDRVGKEDWVILWYAPTGTAAAYLPLASPPEKASGTPRTVTLEQDAKSEAAPFVDRETGSHWDIAGRSVEGTLKGWTLNWLDGTQVKWFAWSAENPHTSVYGVKKKEDGKVISGASEYLRSIPKRFATLRGVDAARQQASLLIEGESLAKVWPVTPDAEIKVSGWWGRLDQLRAGDRVWVWFAVDRGKQPVAVCMLADEPSEQDIHGQGVAVASVETKDVAFKTAKGEVRRLGMARAEFHRGNEKSSPNSLRAGENLYVQSKGGEARLILDAAAFEARRAAQQAALCQRWIEEGLPGVVTFSHVFSGEVEVMLDHEAMRWARFLQPGAKVNLQVDPPIAAVVREVQPWRERTRLRLVLGGHDATDLRIGARIHVKMPAPAREMQEALMPSGLDRPRGKDERVEWLLASIYCSCGIGGDGCTGHFYTLASCNPNACGMPNAMRKTLGKKIDQGLTDRQILEQLLKEQGPMLLRPHLVP